MFFCIFLYIFLIGIKLEKHVTELFLKIFLIVYHPDKHKTQRMCYEAVDDSLEALKHILVGLVQVKRLKNSLYADENILYFNEDSGNVAFSCNEMGILNIDLDNINFDNNFDEGDPDSYFYQSFGLAY